MEEALVAMLLADAGVQAKVVDRVWWTRRPQGSAVPAILLHRIAGAGVGDTMSGQDGLHYALVQVDSWAATYAAAKTTARAVRAVLANPSNPRFTGAFITAERDDVDSPGAGKPDLYRTSLDVRVWFLEA